MNLLHPPRLDALARDYAIGTLHGPARRRFERLIRENAVAERAVLAWQQRLGTLAATAPALEPRPEVWASIERRLFPATAAAAAAAPAARSPWAWLAGLLSARAVGGVLAGLLIAIVVVRQQPAVLGLEESRDALPPSYVGLLHDAADKPVLLASSRRHGRQLTVKLLQPLAVPEGRSAVLWALPRDGAAPFRVGTVPATGSAVIMLSDTSEKLFFGVARLGVTLEAGPAPAQPGGPFVIQGDCVKLW